MSTLIQRFILVFLLVHLNSFSWGNQIAITNARIYTDTSQEWAEAVKIENGKFDPSLTLAMKLTRYFEVSGEDLFIYKD